MTTTSQDPNIRTVLVIRFEAQGDLLLTTPAVRALRRKYPRCRLTYLTKAENAGILAGNPFIDRIVHLEDMRPMNGREYDLMVYWQDHQNYPLKINARKILTAINHPLMQWDTGSRKARSRSGKTYAQIYAEIAQVNLEAEDLPVVVIPDESKHRADQMLKDGYENPAVMNFGSCWTSRNYGPSEAERLCHIVQEFIPVVIVGTHQGYAHIRGTSIRNLTGETTIKDAAEIIRRAKIFIGIDSLPLHLADTLGTPSISVWNATEPGHVLTSGKLDHPIRSRAQCSPCFKPHCKKTLCFQDISPEIVVGAVQDFLGIKTIPARTWRETETTKSKEQTMEYGRTFIVMPCFGNGDMTVEAAKGIFETTTPETPVHLILIDNGNEPSQRVIFDLISRLYDPWITVIHWDKNLGFVKATNAGILSARGMGNHEKDYILWLNNDVVVKDPNWLKMMLDEIRNRGNRAVAGPWGCWLKEDLTYGGGTNNSQKCPYVDYVEGWCLLAPMSLYDDDQVGMLDSKIWMYGEDSDWCIRARREGIPVVLVPDVPLVHLGQKSMTVIPEKLKAVNAASIAYMQKKYRNRTEAIKGEFRLPPRTFDLKKDRERLKLPCPVCNGGRRKDTVLGTVNGFDIVRCDRDGLQRVSEVFKPEDSADLYDTQLHLRITAEWIAKQKRTAEGYWAALDRYDIGFMEFRKNLLDVGCNVGIFLEQGQKNLWTVTGTEFAPAFTEYCQRKGLNVLQMNALDGDVPGTPFMLITMFDVIEHLVNPVAALKRAHEILHPSGVLVLSTPDHGCAIARRQGLKWEHIRPTEHLFHFHTSTLARVLEDTGFILDAVVNADSYSYPGCRVYICRREK